MESEFCGPQSGSHVNAGGSLISRACDEFVFAAVDLGRQPERMITIELEKAATDGARQAERRSAARDLVLAVRQDFSPGSDAHKPAQNCSATSPLVCRKRSTAWRRQKIALQVRKTDGHGTETRALAPAVHHHLRLLLLVPTPRQANLGTVLLSSRAFSRNFWRGGHETLACNIKSAAMYVTCELGSKQNHAKSASEVQGGVTWRSHAPVGPHCLLIAAAAAGGNAMVSADWLPFCN